MDSPYMEPSLGLPNNTILVHMGFQKIRGRPCGSPSNQDDRTLGSTSGSLIFGDSHLWGLNGSLSVWLFL